MNSDDGMRQQDTQSGTSGRADEPAFATDDEQEITLTFSFEPQATLEELFGISDETLFQAFDLALERVGVKASVEVSVLITTDEGIRTLNREYRGKDEPTDVLSFPLLDHPLVDAPDDQLWQPPESAEDEAVEGVSARDGSGDAALAHDNAEDFGADDFTGDLSDDEDDEDDEDNEDDEDSEEQSLKGMIVIMGDSADGEDEFAADPEIWPTHLGDIAISRETALRQARQAGHSAAFEVAFLFVHGVLHLVGFDDHTDAGYQAMVAHQEAALAQAGVTR
ncbi:MAG TPA: rRNA maturation RNase YbeY [Ktedonobacterales bacterium]|jgi:probable rRNA maturation factor|nr:rRNA maturation RNase YbeY [Ktedonobacterales bacterium]